MDWQPGGITAILDLRGEKDVANMPKVFRTLLLHAGVVYGGVFEVVSGKVWNDRSLF